MVLLLCRVVLVGRIFTVRLSAQWHADGKVFEKKKNIGGFRIGEKAWSARFWKYYFGSELLW